MKCIKDRIDKLNNEIEENEIKIFKLVKEIELLELIIDKIKRRKFNLLKSFK